MARKIKETPVLTGKNAERFTKAIEENKTRKVPSADFKRAQQNFKRIVLE